ncbi:MAG: FG-GAP repeat domain-containing protein [Mariniblastus sp.]
MNEDGKSSKRYDIHFKVDTFKFQFGKHESRPHFFDWDRDGIKDIVLVTRETKTVVSDNDKTVLKPAYRIFISKDSQSLKTKIQSGIDDQAKLPKVDVALTKIFESPSRSPNLQVELRAVTDESLEQLFANQTSTTSNDQTIEQHYEFADFDSDGNFDILFSEIKKTKASGKFVISNSIYWMQNLTESGEPKFAAPEKIVEYPAKWRANSFSVADLDGDQDLDIIASVYERLPGDKFNSQLWFLKRK